MRVLQIITSAYRATMEEQDDTVVWLTQAMRGAGGELDLLLTGDSVNYAVAAQDAAGLSFGDWRQTQPPSLPRDIAALIAKKAEVYLLDEDCQELGLSGPDLIPGVLPIARGDLPELLDRYDQVWRW